MDGPGGLEQSMGIGTYNPAAKAIPATYRAQDADAVKKFLDFQTNYKPKTAMDFLQSPDKLQESAIMRS